MNIKVFYDYVFKYLHEPAALQTSVGKETSDSNYCRAHSKYYDIHGSYNSTDIKFGGQMSNVKQQYLRSQLTLRYEPINVLLMNRKRSDLDRLGERDEDTILFSANITSQGYRNIEHESRDDVSESFKSKIYG